MKPDTYREHLNDLQLEVEELRAQLAVQPKPPENGFIPAENAKKKSNRTTGDTISRQAAIDALSCENPTEIYIFYEDAVKALKGLPSALPEIVRCKDCIYYDPEHIENNGIRYEYKDMPKEAFDELETGLVHIGYGINVSGRCCRDYNVGYSEDKRIFVPETNYCGRAERRTDE